MKYCKPFPASLAAIGLMVGIQTAMAAPAFELMTSEEIAAHNAAMSTLQGSARDDYRNAEYEKLRQRALERGYTMSATPPWSETASSTTTQTEPTQPPTEGTSSPAIADAETRHAEMREKMQAHRDALQQEAPTKPETTDETIAASDQPAMTVATIEQTQETPQASAKEPTASAAESQPEVAEENDTPSATAAPEATVPTMETQAPAAPSADSASVAVIEVEVDTDPTSGNDETPASNETAKIETETQTGAGYATSDAMISYREAMRARFDDYMRQRQEQIEENARRQREQHQTAMEQQRPTRPTQGPWAPPHYPAMPPAYGPRYPYAYPGYGMPYWQQPR